MNGHAGFAPAQVPEKGKGKNMKVIDTYNAIVGGIIAVLSYIFGEHWILFALFLAFNIADWITGWMKSRMTKKENSAKGWKGVLKKIGYWIMIAVAFGASAVFMEIGIVLNIDLQITTLLGWFVLASLAVNEIRSICENFVEAGFNVPEILIKGLEVANKKINNENEARNASSFVYKNERSDTDETVHWNKDY